MLINSLQQSNAVTQPKTDAEKATLNYNAFLKLMLEQLKSQDPTNPVDQTQSLAQLASFSGLEQSIKTNQKLDAMMQQAAVGEAAALVGKNIQSLVTGKAGIVVAVDVKSSGSEALLADGSRLSIGDGVRITAP